MKLQFDANQNFQLDAVDAVADLFEGQPQGSPEFSVVETGKWEGLFAGQARTELGAGNQLLVGDDVLHSNLRAIQLRNDIDVDDPDEPLKSWELFDGPANRSRACPHFSVEMETGTGKTYVYLRTIFELARRYGFRKFIIVVPSVAVREGVLKNIDITRGHFEALFDNLRFESYVYDAKRVSQLRQFGTSTTLQIVVINIDAFRKSLNVIYKESDKLSGRQPIEFVQAARPIVIIDEPQSVDSTEKSQEAIRALNPLCTLRYSATHRNPYNLLYRLDPVRAFELKLVKQIVVASAVTENSANDAFVRVEKVEYKNGIKAKLRIDVQTPNGPKAKSVTVKNGDDLFSRSNERANYATGFSIAEINAEPGNESVRFSSGRSLRLGEESGGARADVWRVQIRETVRRHLAKELQLAGRGIKVLSLFFIDRVANYRDYDEQGHAIRGKFAEAVEEELTEAAKEERFQSLASLRLPVESLHNGYFAADKRKVQGVEVQVLKDTRGDSQADEEVYDLIMKHKEKLLSIEEPLRFIFSHSALREGWDNPNVFQICTLNETGSTMKKRQEIGRGLRLPVDQNGLRVFDDSINKLYVMANESYDDFARGLQQEYEDDCGVTFGKVPLTAFAKLVDVIDGEERPLGRKHAEVIRESLVVQQMLDADGRIQKAFDPKRTGFSLTLPDPFAHLAPAVVDLLSSYQIERHVVRDRDQRQNRFRKEISLTPEFVELWNRIKPRTTYRVEFDTETLIKDAVREIRRMAPVELPVIRLMEGQLEVVRGGVTATAMRVADSPLNNHDLPMPDILAYLQNETELTRSTLVRILRQSDRLLNFFINPQQFMDGVVAVLRHVLHRMIVDGIKYERIANGAGAEWEMSCFKNEELINYLSAIEVQKSVYDFVVYDSEVERKFAASLDARPEIKLFLKLPRWFKIDTPVGTYNPDWAIVKHDDQTLYLVRETKATRDSLKLRSTEADKVHCGRKHFEELGVDFDVVVSADEV
jgi:type III restriction enzyme